MKNFNRELQSIFTVFFYLIINLYSNNQIVDSFRYSSSSSFTSSLTKQKMYYSKKRKMPFEKSALTMGMDIRIRIVGRKNSCEDWLIEAYKTYETRLRSSSLQVETIWHKNDNDLVKACKDDKSRGHKIVLLDPTGIQVTSEQLSQNIYTWLEEGGSRLIFVIGGSNGLPAEFKSNIEKKLNYFSLSLSALTFTHQFSRTILMEQIYRASEIRKGSRYHK